MSLEPGGYAEKLGNRYEGRWVALQLLHLLKEDIRSITVEAIGDDEEGVDLWIERKDGIRQAQQCKIENSSKPDWSMADLNRRGILPRIKSQLMRDPNYEFALISGTPANMLRDLSRSARDSNYNPEDFYRYQIVEVSIARKEAFHDFCKYLRLNPHEKAGLIKSFDFLKRTHFYHYVDDQNTKETLNGWASLLVVGKSRAVVASLCDYTEENLRKTISADDLRGYLSSLGFNPRQLSYDKRIAPAIGKLLKEFQQSIEPGLIRGQLIQRDEAREISDAVDSDAFSGLAILHGSAGQGKSGVLFQLVQLMQKKGKVVLPIRLDRRVPQHNTVQFGQELGLPESPVRCLAELAGNRQGVLILDQLDALRWTSSHSTNALEVCRALVREAIILNTRSKCISVIISCRTFDLENDPGIKQLLIDDRQNKSLKVKVGELSEDIVKSVVEAHGVNPSDLSERQKSLLAVALNLSMWTTIQLSEDNTMLGFQTATDLMRYFWKNRYRELHKDGVAARDISECIDKLVDHMESSGQLWAPERLIQSFQQVSDLFHSLGIIETFNRRITFCHQSYLDYHVAKRLLGQIEEDSGSVREWLGVQEKQSLFRREQLKQVLSMLLDENPVKFEATVRELLDDIGIRFHLKHLILSVIGQIREPWKRLLDLTLVLLHEKEWHDHILILVYFQHPQFVDSLIDCGTLQTWLESSNEQEIEQALWLLRSVDKKCGDLISELLMPYLNKGGEWPKWILNTLCLDPCSDSDKMFEMRLELARIGHTDEYIQWSRLAHEYPVRAVQLIEAIVSSWESSERQKGDSNSKKPRFEKWRPEDTKALNEAAQAHPELTWDLLITHIERLTTPDKEDNQHDLEEWYDSISDFGDKRMERSIFELACVAGKIIAVKLPDQFITQSSKLLETKSPIVQRILIETYSDLPPSYADLVMTWFLKDKNRLSIGSGNTEPKWMPAVRFIKKQSPFCSDDNFDQLENILTPYLSRNDIEMAKYWIKQSRHGHYGIWFGKAQYFLLPALCSKRRSFRTEELIKVLNRKFSDYGESNFLRYGHSYGGTVVSPIKNPRKLSDRAWLELVKNSEIPEDYGSKKQIDTDFLAESTMRQFSRSFELAVTASPERFIGLALQFPPDVHPLYIAAVLSGVKLKEPKEVPQELKAKWMPAKPETIEAFLKKFLIGNDTSSASAFCRLLFDRPGDNWSPSTIDILLDQAKNHPDPQPEKLNVHPSESGNETRYASVHTLETNALNCVRGEAARAIGALLWRHSDWYEMLLPRIESLVIDPHPAVRIAALEACLPLLNFDKDRAVKLFLLACQDDLRIAVCRHAGYFFNNAIKSHSEQLAPLVLKMLVAKNEEVVAAGATEVCARWLFYDMFHEELSDCCRGTVAHHRGVARVLSHFLADENYSNKCRSRLIKFFDDPDADVRAEARKAFNHREVLRLDDMPTFVLQYIRSQAFVDDPTNLLYAIEDYPNSLLDYSDVITEICEIFSGTIAEESRSIATGLSHDVSIFSRLILRLYEQSQGANLPNVQDKCLDVWDNMFRNRLGRTDELMKDIDQ